MYRYNYKMYESLLYTCEEWGVALLFATWFSFCRLKRTGNPCTCFWLTVHAVRPFGEVYWCNFIYSRSDVLICFFARYHGNTHAARYHFYFAKWHTCSTHQHITHTHQKVKKHLSGLKYQSGNGVDGCHENPGKWHKIYLERSVSYTLLSSFCAQMGSTDAVTFFIFQKRGDLGFGIFIILGLTRGICTLVEVLLFR